VNRPLRALIAQLHPSASAKSSDGPTRERRSAIGLQAALLSFIAVLGVALWQGGEPWVFPVDDAYITMHNAGALLAGHDDAFSVAPPYGASSPLHLLLVTIARLILSPTLAQFSVGMLGVAAYASGLLVLCRQASLGPISTAIIMLVGTVGGFAAYQLGNGLETGWAMAAVAWAIVLARRAPSRILACLCGLLPFVRPELGLLGATLLARQFWLRRAAGRSSVLIDLVCAAVAAAPFAIWNIVELGSLLPNTVEAKRAYFAGEHTVLSLPPAQQAIILWAIGPPSLALLWARNSSLKLALVAFAGGLIVAIAVTLPVALTFNLGRYLAVLIPIGAWGLTEVAHRPLAWKGIAALNLAWVVFSAPVELVAWRQETARTRDALAVAAWTRTHLPPGSIVLVHDDGAIAEGSNLHLVDLVGLKSPLAAQINEELTLPSKGARFGDAMAEIASSSRAQFAVIQHNAPGSTIPRALALHGWGLVVLRAGAPTIGYDVYRLTPPLS